MKAKAVIRIGRRRSRHASTTASIGSLRPGPPLLARTRRSGWRSWPRGRRARRARSGSGCCCPSRASMTPIKRRQDGHRHDQNDGKRQGPALILGGEDQENEQHRQRENDRPRCCRSARSWKASSVHSKPMPCGSVCAASASIASSAWSGRDAGRRVPLQRDRRVHVVALHEIRSADLAHLDQRAERHQRAGGGAHLQAEDVLLLDAEALVGLGAHLVDAAEGS